MVSKSNVLSQKTTLVVIAASLGGIKAIKEILAHLPATYSIPIAIVQHISSSGPDLLPSALQSQTKLTVKNADQGERPKQGFVYVAPRDRHLAIQPNGTFFLSDGPKQHFSRPAANVLFSSAAKVFGSRIIAIVLTGGDSDGAEGAQAIARRGGTVIVQDPDSALDPAMPNSAVKTGTVDFILPLNEIAPRLLALENAI